jgi:hypothetical protein
MWKFAMPVIFFLTSSVHAGITLTIGNSPQPDDENVQFTSGASGTTILGQTNQSGITVQFSTATGTLVASTNSIAAGSGSLTNVTVSVPNGNFQDLIVNPSNGSGTATITVLANEPGGGTQTNTFTMPLGNGQNFFTVVATGGESIASVTIDAPGGFSTLSQPRISGAVVPEPGSLTIFVGLGMAVVGAYYRRRGTRFIGR